MKLQLHPNSLTIPSEQLAEFIGSPTLARECRAELKPAVDRHKCVLFERQAVRDWFERKYKAPKKPAAK